MTAAFKSWVHVPSFRAFIVAAAVALHGLVAGAQPVSQVVVIDGLVKSALTVDAAALATSPAADVVQFQQSRTAQGVATSSTVRGVRLASLIERAGLLSSDRNEWKTLVVIATATDGYRAVFSWLELTNTAVGDGVLVLFERDGRPLDDHEGRIALISNADRRAGPRYVRNLARVEIRALN